MTIVILVFCSCVTLDMLVVFKLGSSISNAFPHLPSPPRACYPPSATACSPPKPSGVHSDSSGVQRAVRQTLAPPALLAYHPGSERTMTTYILNVSLEERGVEATQFAIIVSGGF